MWSSVEQYGKWWSSSRPFVCRYSYDRRFFLVPHNFTSVAYGRQSTEKLELLVGPLRVLSGKILHRPIQKNYAESRNYAEFAAWCTVHPKLAKIVSAIQKGLDRPKSANYPFLLFTNPEESDDAWYPCPWEKRASVQAPLPSARHRKGRPAAETPRPAIDTLGHIADP